ncbi:hypothetical protein MMC22_010721 [Lobaria immixta]|nr:hypothetical protein [Lobaria immixta]
MGDIKVEPKLGPSNYLLWADDMQWVLEIRWLWGTVRGKLPKPDQTTRPNDPRNGASMTLMPGSGSVPIDALRRLHGIRAKGRTNLLLKRFHAYNAGPEESIDAIASAMENIKSENTAPSTILRTIPPSSMLEQESDFTIEVVEVILEAVQQKLKDEKEEAIENAYDFIPKKARSETYPSGAITEVQESQIKFIPIEHHHQFIEVQRQTCLLLYHKFFEIQGQSRGAARTANEDKSERDESEHDGWRAIDEVDVEDVEEKVYNAKNTKFKTSGWMLHSDASPPMTYQRGIFTKLISHRTSIRRASGQNLWSEGKEKHSVEIDGAVIRMTDVLFVPRQDANLLSISALNRKGLDVLSHEDGVEILERGTSVITSFLRRWTCFLRCQPAAVRWPVAAFFSFVPFRASRLLADLSLHSEPAGFTLLFHTIQS